MEIQVDFDGMEELRGRLQQMEHDAQTAMDQLATDLGTHLESWSGEARELYQQRRAEWDQAFVRMNGILNAAHKHVLSTTDLYMQAETANAQMWSR